MSERFKVVEVNPNQSTGGSGCLCSEVETHDTKGPYAVFYGQDMENPQSPTPVLCLACAKAVVREAEKDVLKGGEAVEIEEDEDIPAV